MNAHCTIIGSLLYVISELPFQTNQFILPLKPHTYSSDYDFTAIRKSGQIINHIHSHQMLKSLFEMKFNYNRQTFDINGRS